jgi:hypothetical protein
MSSRNLDIYGLDKLFIFKGLNKSTYSMGI